MFPCVLKLAIWTILIDGVKSKDVTFPTRCDNVPWTFCYHGRCSNNPRQPCQCHNGYSGRECHLKCHPYCEDAVVCESSNRTHVYYTGSRCYNHSCSPRRFGPNCSQTCHCVGDLSCDVITGECPNGVCRDPYYGVDCQLRYAGMSLMEILVYAGVGAIGLVAIVGSLFHRHQHRKAMSSQSHKGTPSPSRHAFTDEYDTSISEVSVQKPTSPTDKREVVTGNVEAGNVEDVGKAVPESRDMEEKFPQTPSVIGKVVPEARTPDSTPVNTDSPGTSRMYNRRASGQRYISLRNPGDIISSSETSSARDPSSSDIERRSGRSRRQSWQKRRAWRRHTLDRQGEETPEERLKMHIIRTNEPPEPRPRYKSIVKRRRRDTIMHPTTYTNFTDNDYQIRPNKTPYKTMDTRKDIPAPADKRNFITRIFDSLTNKKIDTSSDQNQQRRGSIGYPTQGQRRTSDDTKNVSFQRQRRNSGDDSMDSSFRRDSRNSGNVINYSYPRRRRISGDEFDDIKVGYPRRQRRNSGDDSMNSSFRGESRNTGNVINDAYPRRQRQTSGDDTNDGYPRRQRQTSGDDTNDGYPRRQRRISGDDSRYSSFRRQRRNSDDSNYHEYPRSPQQNTGDDSGYLSPRRQRRPGDDDSWSGTPPRQHYDYSQHGGQIRDSIDYSQNVRRQEYRPKDNPRHQRTITDYSQYNPGYRCNSDDRQREYSSPDEPNGTGRCNMYESRGRGRRISPQYNAPPHTTEK